MRLSKLRSGAEPSPRAVPEAEWSVVSRVASSAAFQKSPRLHELLLHICQRALEGRAEELSEHQIGCEVFGRSPDYDTQQDNIVRVSVSQLRKKLELHFAGEGAGEPVIIEIPRGTYHPLFTPRKAEALDPVAPAAPGAGGGTAPAAAARGRWYGFLLAALVVLLGAFLAVTVWLYSQNKELRVAARPLVTQPPAVQSFWSLLFNPRQRTDIVVADSGVAFLQDVTGQAISLDDYTRMRYVEKALQTPVGKRMGPLVERLASRQYTSAADIQLVVKIATLNRHEWQRGGVRFAKSVETRDFNSHNVILLGSQRSNPWVELFEPRMNFRLEYDRQEAGPHVRNLAPEPGEEAVYRSHSREQPQGEVFGVVAFLPNLDRTGRVLLIAGTGMEATEAAGEYLTNGTFSAPFLESLGFGTGGKIRYFEAVIRSTRAGAVGINPKVVAYRTIEVPR